MKEVRGNQEDGKLVRDAKRNKEDYSKLYAKYGDRVYRYIWRRSGANKETAEDLTQETFLRAFRGMKQFQERGYSYLSYLLRIAHNLLANWYRRGKKEVQLKEEGRWQASGDEARVEQDLDSKIERELLKEAMQELTERERAILRLRYEEECSVRQLAGLTGKSEGATKLMLFRLRRRVRKIMERKKREKTQGVSKVTQTRDAFVKGRA